jgi:hypothetical protein
LYPNIFSIDKNYELYQELKEGEEMVVFGLKKFLSKNPPAILRGRHPRPLCKGGVASGANSKTFKNQKGLDFKKF